MPNNIFTKILSFLNKKSLVNSGRYYNNFKYAIKRTEQLGLELPKIEFSNKSYFSDDYMRKINESIQQFQFNLNDIAAQCMDFNLQIKKHLEYITKDNFIYTIGYVQMNNEAMFKQTDKTLEELLKHGVQMEKNRTLDIHVWLTLPSMEIIDLTLSTTIGKVNNDSKWFGRVFMDHPDNFNGMEYIPLLVGDDFLRKIGALQDLDF